MRKLVVLSFVSLDGVMQAPGGPGEDTSGGFRFGGWVAGYGDDFLASVIAKQMRVAERQTEHPFDLLLGRKTYEIFASYWPNKGDAPIARELNAARKYVVSRGRPRLDWVESVLITGDVVAEIRKLKTEDGPELQVHGSGNLIQTLLKHDLVDELWLKTFPVILGGGKPLFTQGIAPAGFRLLGCETSTTGVIVANYARDGAVKTGSFD